MLNTFRNLRGKVYKIKIVLVFFILVPVTGARGNDIIKNQVEDLNILISQVIGGQPNVLLLFDNSLSMGDNFGGSQVGNWDADSVITTCTSFQSLKDSTGANADFAEAHCIGNASGLTPCGSSACSASQTGTCQSPENFERFLTCIEAKYPESVVDTVYTTVVDNACGAGSNDPRVECTTDAERGKAASAIENFAAKEANNVDPVNFPTLTCGAQYCALPGDADKSCDVPAKFTDFLACMNSSLSSSSCTSGFNCTKPKYGTTRWDAVVNTFFHILDADDSLASRTCDDPQRLFDGASTSIPCSDFMNTPFRDVSGIVTDINALGPTNLPITNAADTPLINELTASDASEFNIRIRPMTVAGQRKNSSPPGTLSGTSSCTGNNVTDQPQGGFAGGSVQSFSNIWKFFRDRHVGGRSPLANAIGFDDSNSSSSTISQDVLDSFRVELQTDPACQCRAEFLIVVTGGLDNCSGDCSVPGTSGSCSTDASGVPLLVTGFSNMRSSIQATSNLRTYYSRNPVTTNTNCPGSLKKEVLTFVIGMGVHGLSAVRTLNAMALAGGTHTTGILKHVDPNGALVGEVEPLEVLPGAGDQVFRDFGTALGINTNPSGAQLKNCLVPSEGGQCTFQTNPIFGNTFFTTAGPLDSTVAGESFAFFVDNPSELIEALEAIFEFVGNFPTSGVAPTAPTSSASVAVSDRILLANLTPNPPERLWQGRLALYGFVDEPGNPGSKVVIRKPDAGADLTDPAVVDAHRIFNNNGVLNTNARDFFWEAGKLLAERDISGDQRHLFTVVRTDPSTIDEEIDSATSGVLRLRYEGDKVDFDNTNVDLDQLGISDADVTDPIPAFCTADPPNGTDDCTGDCPVDALGNLVTPVSDQCKTCVEDCIRDKTVDFMIGNTKIFPLGDPLGSPTTGGQTFPPDDPSFGFSCPDLDAGTGSFDTCSVRLGDIFHSAPVLVGSPSPLFFDVGFQSFAFQFRDRSAAVYAGANDGFMHAFHGGELVSIPQNGTVTNPFNLKEVSIPFFNPGTGVELFGFAPPSFLPDSISAHGPESPSGLTPPDYRFGDFKTFVAEKNEQRSFMDGSALVADIFVDGYSNGIDDAICSGASSALDGNIDSCGSEWHTLLISGYRNGGGAYTALEVTNVQCAGGENTDCSNIGKHLASGPDYPTHLWTLFDHDFGNTWSEPTIGRVRMTADNAGTDVTVDRWVMFVGGGMDPLDTDPTDGVTFGDAFYAIDIPTGKIIFKFNPDDPIPADSTNLTNDADLAKMTCDMSARVGVFDLNADGYMDVAYAGDTCGRLWRFDISRPIVADNLSQTGLRGDAEITAPDWTGDIAFCATADESQCDNPSTIPVDPVTFVSQRMPVFYAPTAVFDDLGQLHVIFVTGNRRNPSSTLQFGKLYNFIDTYIPAFLAGGPAVTVATKTEADFNAGQIIDIVPLAGVAGQFTTEGGSTVNNQGEFIVRFPENIDSSVDPRVESPMGEKGFGPPVVIARALLFTTFAPDPETENICAAGAGEGRLFALDYLSGEPALARVPGAQNLLSGNADQKAATVGKTVAFGMPTPAQLTFGARGSVIMTVAFSGTAAGGGANFLVLELPQLATRTQTLFWEELL